VLPCLEQCT